MRAASPYLFAMGIPRPLRKVNLLFTSLLGFELGIVFLDVGFDFSRHPEHSTPLFFVESNGTPSQTIDREGSLFAYLERDTDAHFPLKPIVFGLEPGNFCLQINFSTFFSPVSQTKAILKSGPGHIVKPQSGLEGNCSFTAQKY